jgi:uncharacterized phage protein gp47/JayE
MAFKRPTLSEIVSRIKGDIETRLSTGRLLVTGFLSIIATAYAGAVHLLHGHIEWGIKQLFPDTAESEFLARWASIWGVKRTSASYSAGSVTFTGTDGSLIPAATRLKRSDGAFFRTDASGTISAGTVDIAVTPVNAGITGDTEADTLLELVSSISGIDTSATVATGGITGGADSESDDSLRERLLDRIKQPPHGGAKFDYIKWAKEVNGVTRAWAYPLAMGAGTVTLTFVLDDEDDIIPDAAKVTEVQNYIDDDVRKPVTADVTVFAPTAVPLNLAISVTPNNAEVRAAVENSIKDLIRREAEPGGTILISKIREAVSIAAGEADNTVTTPSADVTHASAEIATFGVITWP